MKKGQILSAALVKMATAHAEQFDRAGKPYALHPISVMYLLKSDDEELQAIAVLHDVIEDTSTTYQDLRDIGMTERVISAVTALTKMPGETYDEYKLKIFKNRDAMLVKLADLTHNSDLSRMKGISEKDIARTVKYQVFYWEICKMLANEGV